MEFSVVMSVYRNDKPEFVARAIDSVTAEQTRRPDEVVIVVDGPVPEALGKLIDHYRDEYKGLFKVVRLEQNRGLGLALRAGVEAATHPIIARMDSDDVSAPDRFEKQIRYMEMHPNCDVVGGQITEFIGDEKNIISTRRVPLSNEEIIMWLRGRCPLNHMSVTLLRSCGIAVGNYLDWHFNEDYYLWIRMAEAGCRFANLPDVLVNVRVGEEMYARRGGWKYFRSEEGLQRYMLRKGMISLPRYIYNTVGRFVVQVALPNKIRGWVFRKFFRQSSDTNG